MREILQALRDMIPSEDEKSKWQSVESLAEKYANLAAHPKTPEHEARNAAIKLSRMVQEKQIEILARGRFEFSDKLFVILQRMSAKAKYMNFG